jgi:hypothetical protein
MASLGGHETFWVREGWLHRGMRLVQENPKLYLQEDAADDLGVGSNMVKSIRHWLVATGLVEHSARQRGGAATDPKLTDLGKLILKRDEYLMEPGTWWALHINLVNSSSAVTWGWFFNQFHAARFDRGKCLEQLRRHLQSTRSVKHSPRTLERDLACMLQTYTHEIPSFPKGHPKNDPEDPRESPFVQLGLLTHFRESGIYTVHRGRKDIPPEMLGYCLMRSGLLGDAASLGKREFADLTLHDALYKKNGPGHVLCLDPEAVHELAMEANEALDGEFVLQGLAGELAMKVQLLEPWQWLELHYEALEKRRSSDVA